MSATFHNPTVQQRKANSSPSTRTSGRQASTQHTSPQSIPKRAVSGPAGMKTGSSQHPLIGSPVIYSGTGVQHNSRMGVVGVQHQAPLRSHSSVPHTSPSLPRAQRGGYLMSPPHPHHPPSHHHSPPILRAAHPVIRAPSPRHVTLLPTPHSPHPPPLTSAPPAPVQHVPHPTLFNPVFAPHHPTNFNPPPTTNMKHDSPVSHLTPSPTTKFNPFAALGIPTTSTARLKVAAHPQVLPTPYQWNGTGTVFRPVQILLQPAQSLVRFQFDRDSILSASS